ncbi:MAG: hypothetical protein DLM72_07005 [Candidatus Nitrosopolaris wilkensis]|nr:MAG: hypothetical protein DLM72_07005 [Candidatus Nitrosopolaris wilkensis]
MRKTYHKREEFDVDLSIINLKNGLYNWVTDKIQDHTSDYLSVNQVNITYDKQAKPKLFGKYLSEVLYPNEIRTAVEMIAYTFYRKNPFEIISFLLGNGGNGKSVFTSVITAAHGPRNISNVPLRELVDDPFSVSDLENKAANIDPEISVGKVLDPSMLKRLTGKQPTRIQRKNDKAYDTVIHAKLFLSPNKIPQTSDDSDGYYRRKVIVTFPNKFEGKADDVDLSDKLTTAEEMSGMFNALMIALRRLIKNKGVFVNETTMQERREKYARALDPVKAFMNEVLPYSKENDKAYKEDFYEAYLEYCREYRLPFKSKNDFGMAITEYPYHIKDGRDSTGDRLRFWKSIKILDKKQRTLFIKELSIPQESWSGRVSE